MQLDSESRRDALRFSAGREACCVFLCQEAFEECRVAAENAGMKSVLAVVCESDFDIFGLLHDIEV